MQSFEADLSSLLRRGRFRGCRFWLRPLRLFLWVYVGSSGSSAVTGRFEVDTAVHWSVLSGETHQICANKGSAAVAKTLEV